MPPDVIARVHYYAVSAKKRPFYGSAQKDDYLGYIDKGIQSTKAIDYLDYTDNGEKSSGAFGAEGVLTKLQKKELREKLRITQSCIWDMVVSFEEGYGKSNLTDAAAARTVLLKTLPKLFRATGLNPDNMTWFADCTRIRITATFMSVFSRTSRSGFTAKRERSAIVTARYDRRRWIRSKPKSSSILCNLSRASGACASY